MNINEFKSKFAEIEIQGTGVECRTKKRLTWTDKVTKELRHEIPEGAPVHLWFSPKKFPSRIWVQHGDFIGTTLSSNGNEKFTGLIKAPSLRNLQKQDWNGIVKTVTGQRVEPDGYGPDGSPSWMLVLGLI